VSKELRDIIFRMVVENPTWGAPQIHSELMMLGFDISERSVLCWMRKVSRNPEPAKRRANFRMANSGSVSNPDDQLTIWR
jgi:hypothetical protein